MSRQLSFVVAVILAGLIFITLAGCPTDNVPPLGEGSSRSVTGMDGPEDGMDGLDEESGERG